MSQEILARAQAWASHPAIEAADRLEIQQLIAAGETGLAELTERFHKGLEFGTGGLRGVLGMGENRINRYTVRRAAQAFAQVLRRYFPGEASVVVSYDCRHGSREFAEETLAVMAAFGIRGYIYAALTPTPMLSFAIRALKAQGGVMVTASHNPPKYNGYKVFWCDGGQVTPPVDQEIIDAYAELTDWAQLKTLPLSEARAAGLVSEVPAAIDEAFYAMIEKDVIIERELCRREGARLKVSFTPLHGTAHVPGMTILGRLGFKSVSLIAEEAQPNGDFPTVKYPNPEDPAALKLAVDRLLSTEGDVAFGSDPDGDRLGVVVRHDGRPVYLNGNQLGALFLHYVLGQRKRRGELKPNSYVVKSIVTSPVQDAIARHYGVSMHATLTGFKWMADRIRQLEEEMPGANFVFASEESFGYMPHSSSRDKDGISSMALMCEIALAYKLQGKTLVDALDEIAEAYGFYEELLVSLDYEGVKGAAKIKRIMDHYRTVRPMEFAGNRVARVKDYLAKDTGLPKSNVLGFEFQNGDQLFLRPSGTEPKIKFYLMVVETKGDLKTKKANAAKKLDALAALIRRTCEGL